MITGCNLRGLTGFNPDLNANCGMLAAWLFIGVVLHALVSAVSLFLGTAARPGRQFSANLLQAGNATG